MPKSIHNFSIEDSSGGSIDFSAFKGKKILLVNVASECMYTAQYAQLEELNKNFSEKVIVVAVPCNDFGGQEPGSDAEILEFCTAKFNISFPLSKKISIKSPESDGLYHFVTSADENGIKDSEVQWNFQKYIFDEQGILTHCFNPAEDIFSDKLMEALQLEF